MRYRFQKTWCPACKLMQYPGECGHRYAVAPDVAPETVNWGINRADALGRARVVLKGKTKGKEGQSSALYPPLPRR